MSDRLFNDRDGAGKTIGRKLEDRVNDPLGFRTVIVKDGENEIMLRTKGGRPELTVKKPEPKAPITTCVKSPLTEIAFKYHATTAQTGYRRWYGEPDPVNPVTPAAPTYQYSSDGLLCIEARKLQKISFRDANNQPVDFLFAEQPVNPDTPAVDLPAVSASAAASTARFKFIEGKYPDREWYPPERADIGWAFTSPATAVSFFIKRVKSIKFSVTDSLHAALGAVLIKWRFAFKDTIPLPGTYPDTACANQNATEVSFPGREFYASATDGNMEKLTLRTGLAEPYGTSNIRLDFKKPGSFVAAVDPEGATGNTRPADKTKAIDLCEFAAFGNPYHGLVWAPISATPVFYHDSSRTTQWPFTPSLPLHGPGGDPWSGRTLDHRYYNVSGVDVFATDNIVTTGHPEEGALYRDAFMAFGTWYVKDPDPAGWGQLNFDEALYKDPSGAVWVIGVQYGYSAVATFECTTTYSIVLRRRYGVLGTNFDNGNPIARTLVSGTIVTPDGFYYENTVVLKTIVAPNGNEFALVVREIVEGKLRNAVVVKLAGSGALLASSGVAVGDGITATTSEMSLPKKLTLPVYLEDPTIVTTGQIPNVTAVISPTESLHFDYVALLDIYWSDGWKLIQGAIKHTQPAHSITLGSSSLPAAWAKSSTLHKTMEIYCGGVMTASLTIVKKADSSGVITASGQSSATATPTFSSPGAPTGWDHRQFVNIGFRRVTYHPMSLSVFNDGNIMTWADHGFPPAAWAIAHGPGIDYLQCVYNSNLQRFDPYAHSLEDFMPLPSAKTKMVLHGVAIEVSNLDVVETYSLADHWVYSAKIGWAYDYRTKELITVPFGTVAYFI